MSAEIKLDPTRLKSRIDGRNEAKAVIGLVTLENQHAIDGFFDELECHFRPKSQPTESEIKSSEKKLSQISNQSLSFGIHQCVPLSNVPRPYLHWLSSSSEETLNLVNEYLKLTESLDDEVDE